MRPLPSRSLDHPLRLEAGCAWLRGAGTTPTSTPARLLIWQAIADLAAAQEEHTVDIDVSVDNKEGRRLEVGRNTEVMNVPPASGPTLWRFRVWQSKHEYWDLCATSEARPRRAGQGPH